MKYRKRKIKKCGFCCKVYHKRETDYYSHVSGACVLTKQIEDLIKLNVEERQYDRIKSACGKLQ
jgi:hypothetical protein